MTDRRVQVLGSASDQAFITTVSAAVLEALRLSDLSSESRAKTGVLVFDVAALERAWAKPNKVVNPAGGGKAPPGARKGGTSQKRPAGPSRSSSSCGSAK